MAGNMHIPMGRDCLGCWIDAREHPPETLPVRVSWAEDGGASCRDYIEQARALEAIHHTPGCGGCSRAKRARLIREGKVTPHQSVKTRDTWRCRVRQWVAGWGRVLRRAWA